MRLGSLGLPELLIILLVVLLIFGPRRLPDMAKGLGQSVREFRKGVKDMKEDFEAEAGGEDGKSAQAKKPAAEPSAAQAAPAADASVSDTSASAASAPEAAPATAEAEDGSTEPAKKEA